MREQPTGNLSADHLGRRAVRRLRKLRNRSEATVEDDELLELVSAAGPLKLDGVTNGSRAQILL